MADPVPAGSDVSAGTYRCTNCGYELDVESTSSPPAVPELWQRGLGHPQRRRLRRRPVARPQRLDEAPPRQRHARDVG